MLKVEYYTNEVIFRYKNEEITYIYLLTTVNGSR